MRGKKAILKADLFTERGHMRRLKKGETVTILSNEVDSYNKVSVTSIIRYYPIHNIPFELLEIQ
jgi:hypothetical protein